MKDIDILWKRYREFGGPRLLWTYLRDGVFFVGIKALFHCILNGKSPKSAYPKIQKKIESKLLLKYGPLLDPKRLDAPETEANGDSTIPKIVWTCWLQGTEQAPELVKACWTSQKNNIKGYSHRILTLENYRQWITLPENIEEKYRRGYIPAASFSDLLRLAALKKYGGVWLDSTVYCSGFGNERLRKRWSEVEKSGLTLFRYFRRGSKTPSGISTWFIAARKESAPLSCVLDALLAYWNDHNCTVDYYIMHLFLTYLLKESPYLDATIPRENSRYSMLLSDAIYCEYDEEQWQELISHVSFHKLNYRKATQEALQRNTYLKKVIGSLG